MAGERDLDRRIEAGPGADAVSGDSVSGDSVAGDAQSRIQAYQQRLRAGLLAPPSPSRPHGLGRRAVLGPLRKAWSAIVRALP